VSNGTEPSLQASTGFIAIPSYPVLATLQENIGYTVNVPGQEAIKLVSMPQFAITLISLYVPSLGLFQLRRGTPSHLMLAAFSPLPQVKSGGVIGRVAYPEAGTVSQARGSELEGEEGELLDDDSPPSCSSTLLLLGASSPTLDDDHPPPSLDEQEKVNAAISSMFAMGKMNLILSIFIINIP
jgi:hypothetical protein